mgnify:CR=1 FL=1
MNDKKYGDQGFKLEVSHKGNGKLSYSSSNEDVATVDDQGNVTIHNAGTTKLKVTLGVDHNYDSDSKEVTLTVNKINHEIAVDQKILKRLMVMKHLQFMLKVKIMNQLLNMQVAMKK